MTVIALLYVDTVPVLIGDTLISREVPHGNPVVLPGSGDKSSDIDGYVYPVSLKQKVVCINENLAIGWAGPEILAKALVSELREYISKEDSISWNGVNSVFDDFINDNAETKLGEEFSFLVLYRDDKHVARMGHNCREEYIEGYGDILIAGSGADEFLHAATDNEFTFDKEDLPDNLKAPHKIMSIITRLWTSDITSQNNIRFGFGGGYEIATQIDNRIRKVSDILLTSAAAKPSDEDSILLGMNTRMTKFDYIGEYLFIRVFDMSPEEIQEPEINSEGDTIFKCKTHEKRGFIIPPVDKSIGEIQDEKFDFSKLPDFNATYLGVNLEVSAENKQDLSLCFTSWRPKRNVPIVFDGESFYWKPELFTQMKVSAHEFLQANKKQ